MTYLLFAYHKNIIYRISCRFNGDETLQIITFVFLPLKAIRVYTARVILSFYLLKASSVFRIRLTISWNFVLLRTNIKEVYFFQKLRWSKPSEVCLFRFNSTIHFTKSMKILFDGRNRNTFYRIVAFNHFVQSRNKLFSVE